uniref:Uncharacterized protein n=1 Tax=Melopsittacus undulatus TaxID=13146 RepID=A0A8C6IT79_MELUD
MFKTQKKIKKSSKQCFCICSQLNASGNPSVSYVIQSLHVILLNFLFPCVRSLLTGLYPPSSGTIIINGKDIHSDLAAIRTELGVCPQYDVLFNVLTVREHLQCFFHCLFTMTFQALEDVDLSQHQYKPVGALSGGMKRRLSIAISFIGNSKTVVLDEPTSGIDPCSRRSIWDILLKYKAGCTLIFTTHHLDEAEVLSDHIAILQRGQLKCWGSPSYLRETYGQGHSLTLTKKVC